jgi:hypothetical protein
MLIASLADSSIMSTYSSADASSGPLLRGVWTLGSVHLHSIRWYPSWIVHSGVLCCILLEEADTFERGDKIHQPTDRHGSDTLRMRSELSDILT